MGSVDCLPAVPGAFARSASLSTLRVLLLTRSHAVVHTPVLIYNAMRTPFLHTNISARLRRRWNRSAQEADSNDK